MEFGIVQSQSKHLSFRAVIPLRARHLDAESKLSYNSDVNVADPDYDLALRFLVSPFAFGGRAELRVDVASSSCSCSPIEASHAM